MLALEGNGFIQALTEEHLLTPEETSLLHLTLIAVSVGNISATQKCVAEIKKMGNKFVRYALDDLNLYVASQIRATAQ